MRKDEMNSRTLATLANAVELASGVIEKIAGNDISNHINGKPIRPGDLADAVAANLQRELSKHMPA